MDDLELTNILMNNLELVNTLNSLNSLLESILYSVIIALIINIFTSTNKLKKSILSSAVAISIMLISTFASYTMTTYGHTLLQLELGQFLILKQLNITTDHTIISEAISNGTISSINKYSLVSIYTIQNIINKITHDVLLAVIVFGIIIGSFLYWIYKRLKNFNKKTKP